MKPVCYFNTKHKGIGDKSPRKGQLNILIRFVEHTVQVSKALNYGCIQSCLDFRVSAHMEIEAGLVVF